MVALLSIDTAELFNQAYRSLNHLARTYFILFAHSFWLVSPPNSFIQYTLSFDTYEYVDGHQVVFSPKVGFSLFYKLTKKGPGIS